MPATDCPCSSGLSYKECCAPYHRLVREPPDAPSLMRSRYAAFAKKEVAYLARTLHPDHEDREIPEEELLRALRDACAERKFMGLTILEVAPPDAAQIARVLFLAKVFVRGSDVSFAELSEFGHDGTGWRYLAGTLIPHASLPPDPSKMTIATFPNGPGGLKRDA